MSVQTCEYGDYVLRIEHVTMNRGDRCILRDVNAEVRDVRRPGMTQGQVVALLGPSGIGKTTLFRTLSGLEQPTEGRVLLNAEGTPVQRGAVGVVAQNYPLFAHRTVLSNLEVAARAAGRRGAEATQKARASLERFGLSEQAEQYPAQLSGGQRQRVAIAQQFLCSEHFLLMDEPFSGLDVTAQMNVIKFINEIACTDELNTFIVVTHDIRAAIMVADTLWLMGRDRDQAGKLIPGARVQKIYNLVERGLAWQPELMNSPEFIRLEQEIRDAFPHL